MNQKDLALLKELCAIPAPSGSEITVKNFLINYIEKHQSTWKVKPDLIQGSDFQDCLILIFGKPQTAIYAHMDSVGYTVAYNNNLIRIGGPEAESGTGLVGEDSLGKIEAKLLLEEDENKNKTLKVDFSRPIERGTTLTYKQEFINTDEYIQSCYLDNRLGIWNALKVAETIENGAIVFSAWEEVGGGSVGYLARYLYKEYQIKQALISDITWITEGVTHGNGVAISMRDSGIPRKSYINRIIELAKESGIPFQLEVESAGGSDGNALQRSPYPIDWCFVGAGENNVHKPTEIVHKADIKAMHQLYSYLMKHL
ncbi:MAG: aminopeptidase [Bacteroidetes bacterium]|nr:MAG: aminopeptidase [Bacteroidota bacterium]MBL1143950.1 aminopeptidase [Bacteroidota bacterium]NOG56751.1 aminopeptidase [Bacteroidota bacterium]